MKEVVLFWGKKLFQKKVTLTQGLNVADLHTLPSYDRYREFLAQVCCVEGEDAITDETYSTIYKEPIENAFLKCQEAMTMESILEPFGN